MDQGKSLNLASIWKSSVHDDSSNGIRKAFNLHDVQESGASLFWTRFTNMSFEDRTIFFRRLIRNWPYPAERRAVTWPLVAGIITNLISSTLIAKRIYSDLLFFDKNMPFTEFLRGPSKIPMVFGCYTSGILYFAFQQAKVYSSLFSEEKICPSCMISWTVVNGLVSGILMPVISLPYLCYFIMIRKQLGNYPEPRKLTDFLVLGWEASRGAWSLFPRLIALQIIVGVFAGISLVWGRERIYNTIEMDSEFATKTIEDARKEAKSESKIKKFMKSVVALIFLDGNDDTT